MKATEHTRATIPAPPPPELLEQLREAARTCELASERCLAVAKRVRHD